MAPPRRTAHTVFTIGHSRNPIERFLGLWRAADIELRVDVRSQPVGKVGTCAR